MQRKINQAQIQGRQWHERVNPTEPRHDNQTQASKATNPKSNREHVKASIRRELAEIHLSTEDTDLCWSP
jgi:hypothetical protein